ncbi:Na/Pi cotransporter family protein [Alicycliphilus denitrificans]|uniref:Na/Pi cotransporter family protein n=1 Tax=Alicycliphilus denitrificans TaxID=179636 RepID=A0A858ZQX5_9BURK|nr:Na/Pi cotransporter family protein [Alicycliphilus denitrificans]ADU98930.1 Na/Pi-cotransporter II-related protein [Alicycliphilus denitrificans BC]QKD43290.1 Na/Pi cotransporter family protein [Alicycliphilus denitrificans]GAO27034.1 Na/Pi-cotransporter II-like protein [Alicycliphilus sp. B1]
MKHLLNLLAAIALLVWGTHLVRVGVLRVFGANLRSLLARSMGNRFTAALSGIGVTALVQSSTATSLMTASFVGQGLIALPAALAVMRGADIGTALMAVLFSTDLSWLSPLFIFVGVVLYLSRQETTSGRVGRVLIGLGLMLLALERVTQATEPMMASPITHVVLESMGSDVFAEILIGAVLAIVSYSSLAVVLLIAAMADTSVVPLDMALGMVLGANLGNGLTAMLTMAKSSVEVRQVTVGNMVFKLMGVVLMAPFIDGWIRFVQPHLPATSHSVVLFHLAYNIIISVGFIGLTQWVAHVMTRLLPPLDPAKNPLRPHHLDPSALATPSLAISCAAREALHQADLVETMLNGLKTVWQTDDQRLAAELRAMDDQVDSLYSAIKYYMTKISRSSLDENEGRRWTEIISFTINMEQIGDLVERVLQDVEDKKIKKGRKFSHAGLQEINEMHDHLVANLRLAMSVFLTSNARDAQKLLEEKTRFRELELAYSATHLNRLADNTIQSIETSSLHIDIISDLKRINSLLCSVAYPVLEANASIRPLQSQGEAAAPQGERQ